MLSEHLPLLATAPDGVQNLRRLILELAVMGKLIPQDSDDEPASELLKRIANERARLVAKGTCKKSKATPINTEEQPFNAPDGWTWVRLNQLGEFRGGKTPSTNRSEYWDGAIPWVSPKDMKSLVVSQTQDYVSNLAILDGLSVIPTSSVLIVVRSGILRRTVPVAINSLECTVNQDLKALCLVLPDMARYVQLLIRGFERLILETLTKVGTTVESVKFEEFSQQPFPLPPLAEQHRIIAKVEELMALCDQLEVEQIDTEAAHAKLVDTLLATLTQSTNAVDVAVSWQRLAEHFDTLFTTETSLDALKQTILQLAVMGKLIPQDPDDEPASELLKRIEQERTRLEIEGACKKSKPMPLVGDDDRPFQVPDGWAWVRWNDIAQKIGDIDHKMPETVTHGVPYVSPRDFYPDNRIDFQGAKKVSRDDFLRLSAKIRPEIGDIIYPRYGTIGENRLVVDELEFLASYSCCVIKTLKGFVSPKFQFYFSISQCCRDQAKAAENKTTQANVGIKSIQEFVMPLPPLAEQHRIVAKVDELMALCDRLKADLIESRSRQERLALALIETALEAA